MGFAEDNPKGTKEERLTWRWLQSIRNENSKSWMLLLLILIYMILRDLIPWLWSAT